MKKIKIEIANSLELRREAYTFFSKRILEEYGNTPSPLDSRMEILMAIREETIVGTIGLYFGNSSKVLPHNKLYSLSDNALPKNTNVCFISRWASIENRAGLVLSYVSAKYILSKNTYIGISVLKPRVATYLNSISNDVWKIIEGAKLKEKNILPEDKNYFLSDPSPSIYQARISDYVNSLSKNTVLKSVMENVEVLI